MPTRQFAFLIALAAMIATGVGLVLGSRTAPDEVRVPTSSAARADVATPAGEDFGAPTTNSVSAPKTPSGRRGDAAATVDAQRVTPAKRSPATSSESTSTSSAESNKGAGTDAKAKAPAAAQGVESKTANSPDSANRPGLTLPIVMPTAPAKINSSSASDSEFVFVSRSALIKAKLAANEAAAVATLRYVSSAQAQIQSAGVIDTDEDGAGEYGYFGELAGTASCRVPPGEAPYKCNPAVLKSAFGKVTPAGNVLRSGYYFRMYLPGPNVNRKIAGIPEGAGGGASTSGAKPDHDNCEIYYTCYAWPAEPGVTGNRAFFINQEGDLLFLANSNGAYGGDAHAPAFDAALSAPRSGDMAAPVVEDAKCNDGQGWTWYLGREPRIQSFVELGPATKADAEKGNAPDSDKIVVPRSAILRAEMGENESVAISMLGVIALAQETLKVGNSIDTDSDGVGEYGFFGELAGTSPCRAAPGGKRALLRPAMLSSAMGRISNAGNLVKDGYVYRMYLPGATSNGKVPALAEAPGGGCVTSGARPNADNAEFHWAVYAWPLEAGKTGQRAFFADAEGEFLFLENADGFYNGEEHAPAFDAVLDAQRPGDMKSPAAVGTKSVDARTWMPM